MTKIDIFSGFLGAGKTTLIKKLLKEAYAGEKTVLIENEFGEIGIDGGFLKEAGIEITEMNSGCICCSLVGDFTEALRKVLAEFHPDRILIEPSGVGKLSDVIGAVEGVLCDDVVLNSFVTVADATKCRVYMKNFGEFYGDQIENAGTVILSRTKGMNQEKLAAAVALIREHNAEATVITTDWDALDGKTILDAMEKNNTLAAHMAHLAEEAEHHHHHDHDEHCECHEHHHHHDHDEHCECHEHHHHHDHECDDPHCSCHHHDHHHHHADEVFSNWGIETPRTFKLADVEQALRALDSGKYGTVLRAKGIVAGEDGAWIHFDYVPEEINVRNGAADIIGRICVIGAGIHGDDLATLFGVN